jgi:hypothetical protein
MRSRLELSARAQNVQLEAACGSCRVDAFVQGDEPDAHGGQFLE